MKRSRRKFSAKFKASVAIEALKEQKSLAELASQYEIHPNKIFKWKREFLDNAEQAFSGTSAVRDDSEKVDTKELYAQIGQLKVENDFLKKKLKENRTVNECKRLVDPTQPLSVRRQCELLGVARSTVYYKGAGESEQNLRLMASMDRLFTEDPTLGVLGMQDELRELGIDISMDGKGRATDNAYIERWFRTLKQKYVYLNPPSTGLSLFNGLRTFVDKYNNRRHQGIHRKKPVDTYYLAA